MFLAQVGRDEAKARMKELESELARAEQTSALREEAFNYQLPSPPQFRWLMKKIRFVHQKSTQLQVSTRLRSRLEEVIWVKEGGGPI